MSFIGKIHIYVDGASKGNPGPAGVGVVICEPDGTVLGEFKEFINEGNKTNQEAEYWALIKGLEKAPDYCTKQVVCFSDSQLVIKQMNREFRIHKPHLLTLHKKVRGLEGIFEPGGVKYVQISRENHFIKLADKLSKQAIKETLE